MIELLQQADFVLSSCGRPLPPPGTRWVDIPRCIPFAIQVPGGVNFSANPRVENKDRMPFIVRGISVTPGIAQYRLRWPDGRYMQQEFSSALQGQGMGMRTLEPEKEIVAGGKLSLEIQATVSGDGGVMYFYFWGVTRYLIRSTGKEPTPYSPDYSRAPRIQAASNLLAPEFELGGQCTPETPPGFVDEPFTLYSPFMANPVGTVTPGFSVEIPKDCDYIVIKNIQYNSVRDEGVTAGTAAIQIRLPDGRSLTGNDYLPNDWTGPIFPFLVLESGGRIILDVADIDGAGTGNITTQVQFDGVKRRRVQ